MLNLAGRSRLGRSLYRPWLDRRVDSLVGRWYLPLSRAWAAALESGGSVERFRHELPYRRQPPRLEQALRTIGVLQERYLEAEKAWQAAFFGDERADLMATQRRRRDAAVAFMAGRGRLMPLRWLNSIPAVRWQIASADEVEAAHGDRLGHPLAAFGLPDRKVEMQTSRSLETGGRREYWLRFASPLRAAGVACAHVYEPLGVESPPSLIFMHGIAVEPEFVPNPAEAITDLVDRGVRIIEVGTPWHGRRRPAGYYGGELVLARAPLGFLDFFHAAALEAAELVRWARSRSDGAVGVGGYSLGSIASALVAQAGACWPAEARPDAALLIAHGADPARVALEGSLMRGIGFGEALMREGWDAGRFERWMPLVAPSAPPALDPERVVAVLGTADALTHPDDALAQLRHWRVPEKNVYLRPRGHYTLVPALVFDGAPLDRFVEILFQRPGDSR